MTDYKETLELLYRKRDLVTNMFLITRSLSFTGIEEDVVRYIDLIETRQKDIKKIMEIEKELEEEPHSSVLAAPPKEFSEMAELLAAEIKEQSEQIIDMDNKSKPEIQKAYGILKGQVKGVNVSKNIKSIYERSIPQVYNRVDKTK
ncbi:MAG: hypothetical protein FWG63_08840 [Defluviitaleaceae bacterium]|nr:hypothetical protein [Defluviitaleaceae bacterium]